MIDKRQSRPRRQPEAGRRAGQDRADRVPVYDYNGFDSARQQSRIQNFLGHGKDNAIPGRKLLELVGGNDLRTISKAVEAARREGIPICATTSSGSCTCDMCSIVGRSSQVSGVTCKNGIKAWLLDKANQFFPANKCADEIKPLSKQKDSEGTAEMNLADGIRQFYSLEIALGGRNGAFCEWSEIAYELNDDHAEDYSCLVKKICDAFQSISCEFGKETARQLYNAHTIVLPTEIRNAARYLNAGGQITDLPKLASVGFFMTSADREHLERVVTYINAGGNPDNI